MSPALAAPMMRPAMEGRRIREAARGVNVVFGAARNRAMETGRPCGVIIMRFEGREACSMLIDQVEVPPPFAGDVLDATARLQIASADDRWPDGALRVTAQLEGSRAGMVAPGDTIQFNGQGPMYEVRGGNASAPQLAVDDVHQSLTLPWPVGGGQSRPVSYKVFRQPTSPDQRPFTKSSAKAYELPSGAVIDLQFSGTDSDRNLDQPLFHTENDSLLRPIVIMFSPNGSVDRLVVSGTVTPAVEPIYLLVGRNEKVAAETLEQSNLTDMNNLWITLNPQTGLVNSSSMGKVDDDQSRIPLDDARQYAKAGDHEGGG